MGAINAMAFMPAAIAAEPCWLASAHGHSNQQGGSSVLPHGQLPRRGVAAAAAEVVHKVVHAFPRSKTAGWTRLSNRP